MVLVPLDVMAGLVPAIYVFVGEKWWMPQQVRA